MLLSNGRQIPDSASKELEVVIVLLGQTYKCGANLLLKRAALGRIKIKQMTIFIPCQIGHTVGISTK